MDKAQAQLLFLIMIAVTFIGQAIHDFIKKNKTRSRHTIARPQQSSKTLHSQQSDFNDQKKKSLFKSHYPSLTNGLDTQKITDSVPVSSIDEPPQLDEISLSDETIVNNESISDSDELRRAVIWSEILNRKF